MTTSRLVRGTPACPLADRTLPLLIRGRDSYGTSIPKVSIAPSLPSSPVVAQESEAERLAALESVKNALGAPPATAAGAGLGRRATARGRRGEGGARNTVYGAAGGVATPPAAERQDSTISEDDVPLATVAQQKHRREAPPPPVSRGSSHTPNDNTIPTLSPSLGTSPGASAFIPPSPAPVAGRAMSVMSGSSSLGLAAMHGRPDPFAGVTTHGLRASIVETVNVLLKNGEVTRVLVTGEIGLSYRPSSTSSGEQLKLRLTGLDGLEKTAPNPALLSTAGAGEFTVSPSLAAHNGTTVTAFKYQVSLLPTSAALVPLIVKPTWRCEPGLARAIVNYSANASSSIFSASSSSSPFGEDEDSLTSARLEDVKLDLVLASGTATSFQSKPPSGTLTNSSRTLSFSLDSIDTASGGEQKILASIQTEGAAAAQPGPVSVSWTVRGRTVGNVGVEVIEGGEAIEEVRRETVSGKYLAA